MRDLTVLHWRGGQAGDGPTGCLPAIPGVFLIGTCQRRVLLTQGAEGAQRAETLVPLDGAVERYAGREAYAFLLRFAAGLESKLAGETEIFGQLKEAWQQFSVQGDALVRALAPVMQQLFQDTKDVRAQHLSGLGSASYGSLVRRLLGEGSHAAVQPAAHSSLTSNSLSNPMGGPTLVVGAGQLATSVAPWLSASELWIWNRNATRAAQLAQLLRERHPESRVRVLEATVEAELEAWRTARDVVVCIPTDAERDAGRVAAWNAGDAGQGVTHGRVIHLGTQTAQGSVWEQVRDFTSLAAVFELLREHNEQRRRQIERARRACGEKALLRALGGSSTQAHGWEDLLAFGSL
ncbi:MAG: hypothetical protein QM718_05655 [Steroidobacteraceae bacterium]